MRRWQRMVLCLAVLTGVGGALVLVQPYPRQWLFGPQVQGVPLCAWQECFRRDVAGEQFRREQGGFWKGLLKWLGRGNHVLDWWSLPGSDRAVIMLSLLGDEDPVVRRAIAAEYANWSPDAAALDGMVKLMQDPDKDVRDTAARTLGQSWGKDAEAALPKVRELLNHELPDVRAHAVAMLCSITGERKALLVPVLAMLTDDNERVRRSAVEALARGWEGKRSGRTAAVHLLKLLEDEDPMCRLAATSAMWKLTKEEKNITEVLRRELKSQDGEIRLRAAAVLYWCKPAARAAYPELAQCAVADPDEAVQEKAIQALAGCGKQGVGVLVRFLDAPRNLRERALQTLRAIGPDAKEAAPLLLAKVDALGPAALLALGEMRAQEALPHFIARLNLKEAELEAIILGVMMFGADAAEAMPRLLTFLEHDDPDVAMLAAIAIGQIGAQPEQTIPALMRLLDSDRSEDVSKAIAGLGAMGPAAKEAVPKLVFALVRETPHGPILNAQERASGVRALGEIGSSCPKAALVLCKFLDDDGDASALMALAKTGKYGERATPVIIRFLKSDNATERLVGAQAAAKFGPQAKGALAALEALLQDDEIAIYEAAVEALRKVDPERR